MTNQQAEPEPQIDEMPNNRALLAAMSPEERSAIYLNSIRRSMAFFVFLAVAGIVLGVVALVRH